MGPAGGTPVRLTDGDVDHDATVRGRAGRFTVGLDDATFDVALDHDPDAEGRATATVDGESVPVVLTVLDDEVWAHVAGRTIRFDRRPVTHHADAAAMAGAGALASPMPGAVLEVRVAEGDRVEAGQVLLLVEAMKMEHPITAPGPGTVIAVHVADGDAVEAGAALVEYEPDDVERVSEPTEES